ncbi:DUF72 domain-containing protein [Paenibacillus brevis]|uniref:DUF72 domain-containing protein n=1 Tax=Paenibacillus brevis TaxID=2841508 RepID=A0ABS6FNW5_9BACL|nr:DUF72 domain-containing protein [Paenibacillus brevis]MBU5670891.1 DUF72 domain-containing protein [Paenibacillus brevis]
MIMIGLTGWGDHPKLYPPGTPAREKLARYADYFPLVEVDSSFYAVLGEATYRKWLEEAPQLIFILKAYRGMTGHLRGKNPYPDADAMYRAYLDSIAPMVESGRLKAVMFQFPPWFDCTAEHVRQLRAIKQRMQGLPLAIEFRHRSWYAEDVLEETLGFLRLEGWIHIICDEPQIGEGSVPVVLEPTHPELTLVRLHGRNTGGWLQSGSPDWRETRNLYCYSSEELHEWGCRLDTLLEKGAREVGMIFNNNSGGDAAPNALEMMKLRGMTAGELPPQQLDLF